VPSGCGAIVRASEDGSIDRLLSHTTQSCCRFSQYLGDQEELRRRKKEIVAALPSFYDEHYDDFDGRKTNATDIARRDSAMSMFLAKLIQG